jgi:predicted enzyme related to lactoylglutathione lyase
MSAESPATRSQGGFPYAPIFLNVRDVSRSVAFYEKVFEEGGCS